MLKGFFKSYSTITVQIYLEVNPIVFNEVYLQESMDRIEV